MRKINNLDIGLLRTFVTIVKNSSYAQASQVLNLTESAVSHQMRRLEEQIGVVLFQRKGRVKELTPAGEVFLGYAARILELNDELYERMTTMAPENEIIHFGMPEYFANTQLPRLLSEFSKAFPRVDFRTQVKGNFALSQEIQNETIDFAIIIGNNPIANLAKYPKQALSEEQLHWCGEPIDLNPEQPLPLIAFDAPCPFRNAMIQALNQNTMIWEIAYTARSLSDLKAAIKAGLGFSALPAMDGSVRLLDRESYRLPELPELEVRILFPQGKIQAPVDQLANMVTALW